MSILKNIRSAMGMTQRQFSNLLGIERSHYSLAETGLRSLNKTEMLLMHLQNSLQQKQSRFHLPYPEEEIIQEKKRLLALQRKIKRKVFHLEAKLSKMTEQLVNAQTAFQLCNHLKQNNHLEEATAEKVIALTRSKIFANGKLYQEEVRAQLLLLSAEESSIIQRLAELDQNQTL